LDATLTASVEGARVISFKGGEGSIEHFPARHDHYVQSRLRLENWFDFVAPEQLPRQALRAISTGGRAQLAACRDTEPWVPERVRNDDDGHELRVKSTTF
jgi:hypothetical protein